MSINIDITGIYSANPNPIDRRSLRINMVSMNGNSIFHNISVKTVVTTIAYDMYICVYIMFSFKSKNIIG